MTLHKTQQQLWLLVFLAMLGSIGISLPYAIFAPMLLHPEHFPIIPHSWPVSSHAIALGVLLAVYPLGLFFGSPVLGSLSDHYGRRKLIIGSLFGAVVGYILTAISLYCNSLGLLLFARFFTGFAESNVAILHAAVADMPDVNKHHGFGLISTGFTLGYIVGPPLGGILANPNFVHWFNFATPFCFAGLVLFVAAIIAYNTLFDTRQVLQKTLNSSLQLTSIMRRFNIFLQLSNLCRIPSFKLLFMAGFFFFIAVDTYYEFFPAYLVEKRQMGVLDIALLNAAMSFGIALGSSWLTRVYARHCATKTTMLLHILVYASMLIATLLVVKLFTLYVVTGLAGICIAVATNHFYVRVSETAGKDQQGAALGMASGLRQLGDFAISLLGGFLIISSASLPLLGAAIMALLAIILFFKTL